jgi:ribosome-associated translation inhibitor RaiA
MIGPSEHRTDPLAVSQGDELSAPDDASAIANVIEVIGRNVEVPEHFRTHTAHKLANIDRLDDRAVKYTVELFHESNPRQSKACQRVEIASPVRVPRYGLRAAGRTSTWRWPPRSQSFTIGNAATATGAGCAGAAGTRSYSLRRRCARPRRKASREARRCRPAVTGAPLPTGTSPTWARSSDCPARPPT